jgi:hypothetical protein
MKQPTACRRTRQQGAAILMAMLTVVLVATLASAALWQQWRAVEVESAERTRAQSSWVLTGALDWARLILAEDARKGGADHLSEPWACRSSKRACPPFWPPIAATPWPQTPAPTPFCPARSPTCKRG